MTTDLTKMRNIRGIDPDRVDRYGHRFLRLVTAAYRTYRAILEAQGVSGKNVIPISSGSSQAENFDFEDSDSLSDDADAPDAVRSEYFEADTDMSNFNERSKSGTERNYTFF